MVELDKKIAGDWYDIRQIIDDRHKYEDYLSVDEAYATGLVQDLRLSVERGTAELKRKAVAGILSFVDSQQFDARSFNEIDSHIRVLHRLIYVALLQRTFCSGALAPRKAVPSESSTIEDAVRQMNVTAIVAKVQERLAANPALKSSPQIKSILLQVSKYRSELANMKELAPNIPKEKSAAFAANFRKSFDEITRKIQESYAALLREEQEPEKSTARRSMFDRFELKPLAAFFAAQAQEFCRIRSVLLFAQKERFKIREILSEIRTRREASLALVDRELKAYERFLYGHGEELAREFAAEIADYLARKISAPPDGEEWV